MTTDALITLIAFLMASSGVLLVYTLVGANGLASTSGSRTWTRNSRAERLLDVVVGEHRLPGDAASPGEPVHRDDPPEAGHRADARATRGNGPSSGPG